MYDAVAEIRAWHRERCYAMEQRKRSNASLGAYLRTALGWRKDLPESDRKRIQRRANDLIDCGEKVARGKEHELHDTEEFQRFCNAIMAAIASRKPWDDIEGQATKALEKLARGLPVWPFAERVRGFGAVSLAVIIGEAGDLSNYATKSKLWKRMGLAVIDGVRQGGLPKGSSAERWIEHGYSPVRRSRMFVVGDCLIKTNRDGPYRRAYDERKAYELAKAPEMKPIQAHRRAQRYMEKRLLRDLWQAWRAVHLGRDAKSQSAHDRPRISPEGIGVVYT